jgi:prophage regulatory protein
MTDRILRLREVIQRTGVSRSSISEQMQLGLFPKQIRLGKRMVGWSEAELEEHLEKLSSRDNRSRGER